MTIQIVLEPDLLHEADQRAKAEKINRSALIRRALHDHLKRLRTLEMEDRERKAYQAQPQRADEVISWEDAAWPEN